MKVATIRTAASVAVCIAAAILFVGCTAAGPFVTNISSDGRGNLIIEKNMVYHNNFTGTVSLGENPTTQTIRVLPEGD